MGVDDSTRKAGLSSQPLASEAANWLVTEWSVEPMKLATLLGLGIADVVELRAGREPAHMDAAAALRLGVLVGALPGLAERHGRDRICEMLRGKGRAGHMSGRLYEAADVGDVVGTLDVIETLLAFEAEGGDPLASPLTWANDFGGDRR